MNLSIILITCLFLLIGSLALEPCRSFTLDASYSGNSPTIESGDPIYNSLDQLANDLALLLATTNQTCTVFGIFIYPDNYNVTKSTSLDSNNLLYSLSFRKAIMKNDTAIFHSSSLP